MFRNMLLGILCLLCLATYGSASVISVNIHDSAGSNAEMTPDDLAGAPGVRVGNWNNIHENNATLGDNEDVVFDDGTPVEGIGISIDTPRAWMDRGTSGDSTNEEKMFGGVIDCYADITTLTITGIPFKTYTVYFYERNENESRAGIFTHIDSGTALYGRWNAGIPDASGGGYVISTDTTATGTDVSTIDSANCVMFEGLSGKDATFEITSVAVSGAPRNKWCGFQIVGKVDDSSAKDPKPENKEEDVLRDHDLSWTSGAYAVSHDVYFGTDFDDVNDATTSSPEFKKNQTDTKFTLDRLTFGETYYWRIDEVNAPSDPAVFKGDVWSFKVEPKGYLMDVDLLSASASGNIGAEPVVVVNGAGLTDGMHGTDSDNTMWMTNAASPGDGWLQIDMGKPAKLAGLQIWNHNSTNENGPISAFHLGVKTLLIEYTVDGETWASAGEVELAQATGDANYKGEMVSLDNVYATSVKLTIQSGWGSLGLAGLSEVQLLAVPTEARKPVPTAGATNELPEVMLSWRAGREAAEHEVLMGTDPNLLEVIDTVIDTQLAVSLDLDQTYYWQVNEINDVETPSVWEGSQWSVTTAAYLVVDDMELYKDKEGDYIWETWQDGTEFGTDDPDNGSTVGANPMFGDYLPATGLGRGQTLAIWFDNAGVSKSEATNYLSENWSGNGIQTLALVFRGASDNTSGQLYVKINGTKILYDGSAADITIAQWQPWVIDLSSVGGLDKVTEFMVGVEGSNAKGVLYVDDIRLYPLTSEKINPTAPDDAAKVAHYDLNGSTNDSAKGRDGTAMGAPEYVTGPSGLDQGLRFDGTGAQYVDLGTWNPTEATGQLTVSLWVQWLGTTGQWQGLIGKRDSWNAAQMMWDLEANRDNGIIRFGRNGSTVGSGIAPVEGEWEHWAVTTDGATASIYRHGRIVNSGNFTFGTKTDASVQFGCGQKEGGNPFNGALSEIRIYSEVLTDAEIASLAGLTDPIYKPF